MMSTAMVSTDGDDAHSDPAFWTFCPSCGSRFSSSERYCEVCDADCADRFKSVPPPKQPWGKWLWKRQPYEDNYVDEGLFLRGLRTNINVVEYEYWDVVVDSTVITGQVMTVALFNTLFLHLYKELIPPVYLGSLCVFFLVLGFAVRIALEWGQWTRSRILSHIRSLFLVFFAVWTASPILQTLTDPLSDDTLLASTLFCYIIHFSTQDYAFLAGLSDKFSAPVSLNAALFACVIVVSRLPTVGGVFVSVSLAIELFALFPVLRHCCKVYSSRLTVVGTALMYFATAQLLSTINYFLCCVFVGTGFFITFVCPYWLIRIQKYKNTIHGPWDEAIPSSSQSSWKQ